MLDFEEARRQRDTIALMCAGAPSQYAKAADPAALMRQQSVKVGLGSRQQRVEPPTGWAPP